MPFITGKHLERRTFLRGMGASVALPFLDAMVPAARSAAADGPTRLIAMEVVHGFAGGEDKWAKAQWLWSPEKLGRDFEFVNASALKPLEPSVGPGATNVGYLVVLTNGITAADGTPAAADADYADFKAKLSTDPTCALITNTSLNGLCRLTGAQLRIAGQALQLNPANIVLTFSFSTQATRDTMNVLAQPTVTTARPIAAVNIGATTAALTPPGATPLPGHANVYRGTLQIPYYSSRPSQANPTAPLTTTWLGNPSALDPNSRLRTRFNPVPVATATISIPLLVTVPNAASPSGGTKPAGGWR